MIKCQTCEIQKDEKEFIKGKQKIVNCIECRQNIINKKRACYCAWMEILPLEPDDDPRGIRNRAGPDGVGRIHNNGVGRDWWSTASFRDTTPWIEHFPKSIPTC